MTVKYQNLTKAALIFTLLGLILVSVSGCGGQNTDATAKESPSDMQTRARAIVAESLETDNPRLRAKAIEVVADIELTRYFPKVRSLLTDDFVPVRFSAAVAMGQTQHSPAQQTLRQLLRDREEDVRIAAAFALYRLGDENQMETLYEATKSSNQTVRSNAVFLLGKTQNSDALPVLYDTMRSRDSTDQVRLQAAEAIARLGDEQIFKRLWTMLISAFADDRAMGINAMAALGTIDAESALVSMLTDTVTEVRLIAAGQLATLNNYQGSQVVVDAMNNLPRGDVEEAERIKMLAAMAIGNLCTPDVSGYLNRLIRDESEFVRLSAAKASLMCHGR